MIPTDWHPLPAATCCDLARHPRLRRHRRQLHQPRGRRSVPPPRGRAESQRRRHPVLDDPQPRRRGHRPARSPRTSPSKAICRPLHRLTPGPARHLPLCINILRGVRGAAKPPALCRQGRRNGRYHPARKLQPDRRRPTGTRWPPPNRPTVAARWTPSPPTASSARWKPPAQPAPAPAGRPRPLILHDGGQPLSPRCRSM